MSKSKFGTAKATTEQPKKEQPATDPLAPPDGFLGIKKIVEATSALEEKTMNYKWRYDFKLTTGIKVEIITIETKTEADSERLAFNQALAKMTAHEKYRGSTDLSYTQKFTKEKITQE